MSLTQHTPGSLRELWTISFPLMISLLAMTLMLFVDRWFLAHYSQEAFNAAVIATTLGWTFVISSMVLTSIAEVFVAQYNGAGFYHRLAEPVWQMIWLSLGLIFLFVPLALFFW